MKLELEKLSGAYTRGHWIIKDIDLKLEKGEKIAILGRNGAGKSTFIKAIMSLLPVKKGQVLLDNSDISDLPVSSLIKLGIGYFTQGGVVFPHLSIDENLKIAMGNRVLKKDDGLPDHLRTALPIFQMKRTLLRKAGDLSGGERTQLALAMVLINKPGLLLLDEPFAGISPNIAGILSEILIELYSQDPFTMILVGQNQNLAASLTDRSYIIRDGRLNIL